LHFGRCEASYDAWARADGAARGDALMSFHARADVFGAAWWAHAAWTRGRSDQAAELAVVALQRSFATGHVPSQVVALAYGALTAQLLGDRETCTRRCDEAMQLCDRYRFTYYGLFVTVLRSWCRGPEAADDLRAALGALRAMDAYGRMPYWMALLTDLTDDPAEIEELLTDAISLIETGHEHLWLPELWRRQATMAQDGGQVRALLTKAHELAVSQGNVALADRITDDWEACLD
jgi:hypothetical protein